MNNLTNYRVTRFKSDMNSFVLCIITAVFSQKIVQPHVIRPRNISIVYFTKFYTTLEPNYNFESIKFPSNSTKHPLHSSSNASEPCNSSWECAAVKGLWLSRVLQYVMNIFYNESCDKFKSISYLE